MDTDTDTTRPGTTRTGTTRGGGLVTAALVLAALAWAVGTPVLFYGAMISGASFFGESPSAAELATSARLAWGAVACGVGAPAAGLAGAITARRRVAARVFGGALGVTAGAYLLLVAVAS